MWPYGIPILQEMTPELPLNGKTVEKLGGGGGYTKAKREPTLLEIITFNEG